MVESSETSEVCLWIAQTEECKCAIFCSEEFEAMDQRVGRGEERVGERGEEIVGHAWASVPFIVLVVEGPVYDHGDHEKIPAVDRSWTVKTRGQCIEFGIVRKELPACLSSEPCGDL